MNLELRLNNLVVPCNIFTFSAGEEHVIIDTTHVPKGTVGFVKITAKMESSKEIIQLVLLVDAVRRLSNLRKDTVFELYMPYTPFGRQDRVMNSGEPLSISVFADIVNMLKFDKVVVEDPHSDVQLALFNNVFVVEQHEIVIRFLSDKIRREKSLIVSPDAGAIKKSQKLVDKLKLEPVVIGYKKRDTKTGHISGTGFVGDVEDRNVLIVDDCIDGGYTFIKLGESLKLAGAKKSLTLGYARDFFKGCRCPPPIY